MMDIRLMVCPNVSQQERAINSVFDYLHGASVPVIHALLEENCNKIKQSSKETYQLIQVSPEVRQRLFSLLLVPKNKQKCYNNTTSLRVLLTRLDQDGYGHNHLVHLLHLINTTKQKQAWLPALMTSLLSLTGLGVFFYIKPGYFKTAYQFLLTHVPRLLKGLMKTFSILRNVPLLGMAYSSASLIWHGLQTFYYGTSNLSPKLTSMFFSTLTHGLSIAGYALCFMASGVATPLTSMLFVMSASVDMVRSLVNYGMLRQKAYPPLGSLENTWEAHADHARQKTQRNHAVDALWTNFMIALLSTAVITTWCFFPPSIVLTLGCMSAILLMKFVKSIIMNHLNEKHAVTLQTRLQLIDAPLASQGITPAPMQTMKSAPPVVTADLTPTRKLVHHKQNAPSTTSHSSFFKPLPSAVRAGNEEEILNHAPACSVS
jgi:hypothetical protein